MYFERSREAEEAFRLAKQYMADGVTWWHRTTGSHTDEPPFGCAMGKLKLEPLNNKPKGKDHWMVTTLNASDVDIDIIEGEVEFEKEGKIVSPTIVHFTGGSKDVHDREANRVMMLYNSAIVVITGRNIEGYAQECISKVLEQDYADIGIVIVDDASTDHTSEIIDRMLGDKDDVIIVRNEKKHSKMENWEVAVRDKCSNPKSVIFLVDGDDYLIASDVISKMMEKHKEYDVVWSQYVDGKGNFGICRPLKGSPRKMPWVTSHLKSFKKWLFDAVKPEDFKDENGRYFESAVDMAVMLPVLEMAGPQKCFYLDEVLYQYRDNPDSMHVHGRNQQRISEHKIRAKKEYSVII
jgi:hypothetical protein